MRISYPQFCAKETNAFMTLFPFARRKPPSVFLRGAYPDLPLCIVYIADGIWLCADRVCVPSKAVFSCWYGKTPFMCGLSRAVSGLPCPSLFPEKGGKKQPDGLKTRPAGGSDGMKTSPEPSFLLAGGRQPDFSGVFIWMRPEAPSFLCYALQKGGRAYFFGDPCQKRVRTSP